VSGIVSARSGNTLTVEDATLIGIDGSNAFMGGTATVKLGASTLVTVLGQGAAGTTPSLRSRWIADLCVRYGDRTKFRQRGARCQRRSRATRQPRLRFVTVVGSGSLDLKLGIPGRRGRSEPFDFVGSGSPSSAPASAGSYVVSTGALDLTNSTVGVPVVVTGLVTPFVRLRRISPRRPYWIRSTISAELVADYGSEPPHPHNL